MSIERWFEIDARGSTIPREVMAGASTFLALSYIFVVNPSMLAHAGMPWRAVFFATIVASAAATFVMGLWANLPYVLAPGMEINSYVAFYAIGVAHLSWQQALGAVFWSGVLFLIFTFSGIRQGIIDSLPAGLKRGLGVAVGVLLAAVAFRVTGILRYDSVLLTGIAWPGKPAFVLLVSAAIVTLLARFRVRAAVLLSIVAGSAAAALLGPGTSAMPASSGSPFAAFGAADLGVIFGPHGWTVILVLFLVDFYGSVAKLVGLVANTSLLRDGRLPRMHEALVIDGAAATAGSLLGTTSVLVYAESGVGIAAGGRTGLTAVTAALAMLACFAAAPLLVYVPIAATGGALLYVAYQLLPSRSQLQEMSAGEWIELTVMAAIVVTTFSIDRALLAGLLFHLVRNRRKGVRLNAYPIGSAALLLLGWVIS